MSESDLGPKPDPQIEPGEPNPGGVDAQPEDDAEVVPADLPTEKNPAVDTASTQELTEGEDTSTQATRDEDPDGTEESPA
jgi:hypothetical protein